MNHPHDELRDALGAYALGQLDADLRREVDDHLQTCADCRAELDEIAPVAESLRAVDPDAVVPLGLVPPAELDERIRLALPAPRRGPRRLAAAAGALVATAAATALLTVLVTRDDAPTPTVIAVPRVAVAEGVTASAGLVDHTWGLEIKLQARGLPAGQTFSLRVVGDDGRSHDAGQFVGVAAGTTITCDMSSSVLLDDAASFQVVDAAGAEVIAGDVPS